MDTGKGVNCISRKVAVWNVVKMERVVDVDRVRKGVIRDDFHEDFKDHGGGGGLAAWTEGKVKEESINGPAGGGREGGVDKPAKRGMTMRGGMS
jgi:hypothetical protein